MNKKGFNPIPVVISYWWVILIIIGAVLIHNFAQDYFNPEYCLTDSFENRAAIEAHGFKLSDSQISQNKICFRSNDQILVQEMIESINDKQLEKEFELQMKKEENRNQILNTLLEPEYFYPILVVVLILGIYYIKSKHK